jgi:hypothetical protein
MDPYKRRLHATEGSHRALTSYSDFDDTLYGMKTQAETVGTIGCLPHAGGHTASRFGLRRLSVARHGSLMPKRPSVAIFVLGFGVAHLRDSWPAASPSPGSDMKNPIHCRTKPRP